MPSDRRCALFSCALFSCIVLLGLLVVPDRAALADPLQQQHVTIAVGGVTGQMDKLPYAVAIHRGFFKQEGLDVESIDFNSGARALEAMIGGSADITQAAYEHVPRLQAQGIDLMAFAMFSRYPANVLMIPKVRAADIRGIPALKGKTIGVSSPGSATQSFFALVMKKFGMGLDCCTYVGVGAGPTAVAALRAGRLDALVTLDPNTTVLTSADDVVVLADSRTAEGTREYYGGDDMISSLYGKRTWVTAHPDTVQALTNGISHAKHWLRSATLDEIVDAMPKEYWLGNRTLYRMVVEANLPSFLWDGIGTDAAARNAFNSVVVLEPDLRNAKVDLSKTYTNDFMIKANQKFQ
jgi:NitT/TauT family transport system substrate-binding protein